MRYLPLFLAFISGWLCAETPKIHTVAGKHGTRFQHFEFEFTAANTILPGDAKIKRKPLGEQTKNFSYGQFEIYIPAEKLTLEKGCKSNYIVRMPMTLDQSDKNAIAEKQTVFRLIRDTVETRSGSVLAVIEIPYGKGCNLFFRTDSNYRYINYIGPIKK